VRTDEGAALRVFSRRRRSRTPPHKFATHGRVFPQHTAVSTTHAVPPRPELAIEVAHGRGTERAERGVALIGDEFHVYVSNGVRVGSDRARALLRARRRLAIVTGRGTRSIAPTKVPSLRGVAERAPYMDAGSSRRCRGSINYNRAPAARRATRIAAAALR